MKPWMLVPAWLVALLGAGSAAAVPIRTLPDLVSVRVYEITFGTVATTYAPGATELTTRLADPLSATNRDFSFVANELYDVFYSNADGTPNPDGDHITVEGVWRVAGGAGGMNINEVELVLASGNRFGDFVSSFEYGTGNVTVGSEGLAVDGNLATFPRFGNTSVTDLADRFHLTIGFDGISVPEPGVALLLGASLVLVRAARGWRR